MIKCDSCGWENPLHAAFCTNCGTELDRAEMSLSTDMSGSDDLSLDGSESKQLLAAARESALSDETNNEPKADLIADGTDGLETEQQEGSRARGEGTETDGLASEADAEQQDASGGEEESRGDEKEAQTPETEPTPLKGSSVPSVDGEVASALQGLDELGYRATLQLTPEIEKVDASIDDEHSSLNEQKSEPDVMVDAAPSADGPADSFTDNEAAESDISSSENPSDDAPSQDTHNDSAAHRPDVAYVAFDDGIPDDQSIHDQSLQSLDIGVESLSLDDSLHLGRQSEEQPLEAEATPATLNIPEPTPSGIEPEPTEDITVAVRVWISGNESQAELKVELGQGELTLGRSREDSALASDRFVSPEHCSLSIQNGVVVLQDLASLNGTWLRVVGGIELVEGQEIRLGSQHFRVTKTVQGDSSRLETPDGTVPWSAQRTIAGWSLDSLSGDPHRVSSPIPVHGLRIGRLSGNLVFEDDLRLGSVHALMVPTDSGVVLKDLNTSEGTWLRVDGSAELGNGTEFIAGSTRMRLEFDVRMP